MESIITLLLITLFFIFKISVRSYNRRKRTEYYHKYLNSDDWQRKKYVVLTRDNYRCVYCGKRATQVHHKKYAKYNIGKEPINWLVSICAECHAKQHSGFFE